MWETLLADFEDRAREVDLYFQFLIAMENDEFQIVKGTGAQVVQIGDPPAEWKCMLKGGASLVLYNLVESFMRRGFQSLFNTIKSEGLCGNELIDEFILQWVEQRNRAVSAFDGSPKV